MFGHSPCNIHVFTKLTSDTANLKLMDGCVNTSVLVNSFGAKKYHNPKEKLKAYKLIAFGKE
jgi:hypothetical protein